LRSRLQRGARYAAIAHDPVFTQAQPGGGELLDQRDFVAHLRSTKVAPHIAPIEGSRTPGLDALRMNRDGSEAAGGAAAIGGLPGRTAPTVGKMLSPSAAASPSTVASQTTPVWPVIAAGSGLW
jgi:hypothetical protein